MAIGGELRHVAVPQGILSLAADDEVGAAPCVALTVEHHLRPSSVPASGEFERQDPRARRKGQVRHEWGRTKMLALRHWIEPIQQREDPLRLVRCVACNRMESGQGVSGRLSIWPGRGSKEAGTCVRLHLGYAAGDHAGEGGEVGHGGRLGAVEPVLNHAAIAARGEIDEVGHVPCGDPQAEGMTADRGAFEKLVVGPHRRDRRELVDRYRGRRFAAQHCHERDGRVFSCRAVCARLTTLCDQIENVGGGPRIRHSHGIAAVGIRACLR